MKAAIQPTLQADIKALADAIDVGDPVEVHRRARIVELVARAIAAEAEAETLRAPTAEPARQEPAPSWKMKRELTPAEAVGAGYFGSVHTAAKMRSRRTGPAFLKTGDGTNARVVYPVEELERWAKSRRQVTLETFSHHQRARDGRN